jgi:hypothetical protein
MDAVELYAKEREAQKPELGTLTKLCDEMVALEMLVGDMEEALKVKKSALQEYRVQKIPGLMQELGVSNLTLTSGAKIVLQRVVSCRLNQLQKLEAFEWLEKHEFGAMIKREVAVDFGRNEEEIAAKAVEALTALGLKPSVNKDVHFQTLSAWSRKQLEAGGEIPATLFELSILNLAKLK